MLTDTPFILSISFKITFHLLHLTNYTMNCIHITLWVEDETNDRPTFSFIHNPFLLVIYDEYILSFIVKYPLGGVNQVKVNQDDSSSDEGHTNQYKPTSSKPIVQPRPRNISAVELKRSLPANKLAMEHNVTTKNEAGK